MSKVGLFIQRWSRLKSQSVAEPVTPPTAETTRAKPELPPVEDLTLDSDFSAFMQPEVDADTRRAAMKRLFMNDHYRTMDMLDVYVDDYSKPAHLPIDMLADLRHAVGALAQPAQAAPESSPPAASPRIGMEESASTADGDGMPADRAEDGASDPHRTA